MYSGMMPNCVGTIIVAMIINSRTLRPRNFSFANANPASVEKNTTLTVIEPDTRNEFVSARTNGTVSKARCRFANRVPPNRTGGGTSANTELSLDATTNDQYKGNAENSSNPIRNR